MLLQLVEGELLRRQHVHCCASSHCRGSTTTFLQNQAFSALQSKEVRHLVVMNNVAAIWQLLPTVLLASCTIGKQKTVAVGDKEWSVSITNHRKTKSFQGQDQAAVLEANLGTRATKTLVEETVYPNQWER